MSLPDILNAFWRIIFQLRYLALFIIVSWVFWKVWVYYLRASFLKNLRWVLLEIKIPREITKSPRAMEVALNAFHNTKDGNLLEKYWKGFLRPYFSLEIVSIGGEIHFFVYTQEFFRNLVEAQIYAQYPDVEITEVDDYTKMAFTGGFGKEWGCYGTEYVLTNADAYPIKTYIDYGLHEMATKEEQKTDPITSFLEVLGYLKEGEQMWMQILIRATKKEWEKEGKKLVEKLMKEKEVAKEETINVGTLKLTPGEKTIIEAIERDVSKLGFDVGIRQMYLAKNEKFNAVNVASMIGAMKQYNALNLNGFKPARGTTINYFFKKTREAVLKTKILDFYRSRSYFYINYEKTPFISRPPFVSRPSFVLNSEELATIFHFPGRVAETPTFGRIEAKKGEPPQNLPF